MNHNSNPKPSFAESDSIWLAEHQQLHIDLQPLLNQSGSLILTGWDIGIRWLNIIDGESTTVHTDPFAKSLFPIEFIDHDLLKPWAATIPETVITLLKRYKGNAFGMLMMTSRHRYAYQLFLEQPILFWVAFCHAQQNEWSEAQFIACCQMKRTAILDTCDLPPTRSALKLLSKIQAEHFGRYELDQIRALLNLEGFEILNHRLSLPLDMVHLILKQPNLLGSKFVIHWQDEVSDQLYRTYLDIMRMVSYCDAGDVSPWIHNCKNMQDLTASHDRLVQYMNDRKRNGSSAIIIEDCDYPAPPVLGTETIVPIDSFRQLRAESMQQHHCVEAYHARIVEGHYYVYQILAPERATLGLRIVKSSNGKATITIDQIKGLRNQAVSSETEETVLNWLELQ
jgi:hypothetical protein